MSTPNKNERIAKDTTFAHALDKNCSKMVIHVSGESFKGRDLADKYRAHAELEEACVIANAKWRQLVAQEREARAELATITGAITAMIPNVFGVGSDAYNDFRITERKVRKVSLETKVLAAAKLRATREARHTMGKRQRLAIVGTVGQSTTPPAPAASADPAVSTIASNGQSSNGSSH